MYKKCCYISLIIGFLWGAAFLLHADDFAGGSGSSADPYQVQTAEHLNNVRKHTSRHFIQIADIDLTAYSSGKGWNPIPSFSGSYDGDGYLIRNLIINRDDTDYVGLFASTTPDARLTNINMLEVQVTGKTDVGALVGFNRGGNIDGCSVSGDITGSGFNIGGLTGRNEGSISNCYTVIRVTGDAWVGGLVGENDTNATIHKNYSTGLVSGERIVGGLIGRNNGTLTDGGIITESYATGAVTGEEHSIGGLVGLNLGVIEDCYSTSRVSGSFRVGGLAGRNGSPDTSPIIRNSYATGEVVGLDNVGGLVGEHDNEAEDSIVSSYYDRDTTGQADTGKGIPLTTEEMKQQDTFENWNFDDLWTIIEDSTYPYLQWIMSDKEYDSRIESYTMPKYLFDGYNDEMVVTVRNTGEKSWETGEGIFLKAVEDTGFLALEKVALEKDVAPGEWHEFTIGLTPQKEGFFILEWRMIRDNDWFGESFRRQVEVLEMVFDEGAGTADDPYLVKTPLQLHSIRFFSGAHFIQVVDISLSQYGSGEGWRPIGTPADPFNGSYNGQGYSINGLVINREDSNYIGLFGYVAESGVLKNIRLTGVNISGGRAVGGLSGFNRGEISYCHVSGTISGDSDVGGLAGTSGGIIHQCSTSGEVNGERANIGGMIGVNTGNLSNSFSTSIISGRNRVGGLVGDNKAYIERAYATGTVDSSGPGAGGLVGRNDDGSTIIKSLATGNVSSSQDGNSAAGGLAGSNEGDIYYSYALGIVTGDAEVGGLVGNNRTHVEESYSAGAVDTAGATVGGLVGRNDGSVERSFYDYEASGQNDAGRGIPMSTEQMMQQSTFESWDWDFVKRWGINENENYPFLQWEKPSIEGFEATPREGIVPLTVVFSGQYTGRIDNWTWDFGDENTSNKQNPSYIYTKPGIYDVKLTVKGPHGQDEKIKEEYIRLVYVQGGEGTKDSPYLVRKDSHLHSIQNIMDAHYKQTSDIDLRNYTDGKGWEPIGNENAPFTGSYDGNGYKIRNLVINRPDADYIGFFGYAENAVLQNMFLQEVKIRGYDTVGSLTGYNKDGDIKNSYATGEIEGNNNVGGLVGKNTGELKHCYTRVIVSGIQKVGGLVGKNEAVIQSCGVVGEVYGEEDIGGLAGYNNINGEITECFAVIMPPDYEAFSEDDDFPVLASGENNVGGLVGENEGRIANSYVMAENNMTSENNNDVTLQLVSGEENVGGLVGRNAVSGQVNKCFATGKVEGEGNNTGGLVGENQGIVDDSYYDKDTTGQDDTGKGIPRSTEQMMQQTTFEDWNFDETWEILEEENYPFLQWEKKIIPEAALRADNTTVRIGQNIQFTDHSTTEKIPPVIISWKWDFGDGNTSTRKNPVHNYAKPGTYSVTLTVYGLRNHDTITREKYISIADYQLAQNIRSFVTRSASGTRRHLRTSRIFGQRGRASGIMESPSNNYSSAYYTAGKQEKYDEICEFSYNASFESSNIPFLLAKDIQYEVQLTVKNTGENTWKAEDGIYLAAMDDYDDLAPEEFWRMRLIEDVLPGETYTFSFELHPEVLGTFTTEWRILKVNHFWIGEVFSKEINVVESLLAFALSER